jgi:hypothetical protein
MQLKLMPYPLARDVLDFVGCLRGAAGSYGMAHLMNEQGPGLPLYETIQRIRPRVT